MIYGRDPTLPQDLFLPLKSGNKRQITTEDDVEYKMMLLKELHAAYETLNQDKIKERYVYKTYKDDTLKNISFNFGDFMMLFTPQTEVGMTTKFFSRGNGPF